MALGWSGHAGAGVRGLVDSLVTRLREAGDVLGRDGGEGGPRGDGG